MQPRKMYNTLVGQLFNVLPIKTDDAIDSTMRRKIQKLHEYLQVNPAKVPKVWSSLLAALCASLCVSAHPAGDASRGNNVVLTGTHSSQTRLPCALLLCNCCSACCVHAHRPLGG
jgi:hypothetical protein